MAGRPRLLPYDFSRIETYLRNWRRGADLFKHMKAVVLISSTVNEGEISLRMGALLWLQSLRRHMKASRFDYAAYERWLSCDKDGAVLVPVWVVNEIVAALSDYEGGAGDNVDLDKAFGATGLHKNRNARQEIIDARWNITLASMVLEEKTHAQMSGEPISDNEAIRRVLARLEGETVKPSQDTVERAWSRWRKVLTAIESAGLAPER